MAVTVRASAIAYVNNTNSTVFAFPTGSLAGDTCCIFASHGWAVNTPIGWDSLNNVTGSNINGACFVKELTADDITAGSVTITFSGNYYGTVAGITFVGVVNAASPTFLRSSGGAASSTISTAYSQSTGDYAVYFGSVRASSTVTSSAGSVLQSNSAANSSAVLAGGLLTADGIVSNTFSYSTTGAFYEGIVVFVEDGNTGLRTHQVAPYVLAGEEVPSVEDIQSVAYAMVSEPAQELRANQVTFLTVNAAEEPTGLYNVYGHQFVAYALVKGLADRQDLRAWPFVQDDHIFYVLQLGSVGTLVYDMSTDQWAKWFSPGKAYYRGQDGVAWEGYNICCDTESGILWEIDPTGRLDNGDTAITSKVTGGIAVRLRKNVPCYLAELTCSETTPSTSGTSISLRTSDDEELNWTSQGTVDAEPSGSVTYFRWYGLGTVPAPGRVFEITNAGYARRINGFSVELGGIPEGDGGGN